MTTTGRMKRRGDRRGRVAAGAPLSAAGAASRAAGGGAWRSRAVARVIGAAVPLSCDMVSIPS